MNSLKMNSLYEILAEYPHNAHYLTRYIKFIKHCTTLTNSGYTEKHHICMKSMFPDLASFAEFPWNCVVLTARQHYIAHLLLWKAYRNRQTAYAFHIMIHGNSTKSRYSVKSSRIYASLVEECKQLNSGKNHPLYGTKKSEKSKLNQKLAVTGKKQTEEHINKRVTAMLHTKKQKKALGAGYSHSLETRAKISQATKGITKPMTEEHLAKLRCHLNNTTQVACPYCNKVGQLTNMKRWHFDKCKSNPNRVVTNKKVLTCSICNHQQVASPNFYRYHETNCASQLRP